MELTSNYKTGRQFVYIVAITRQCYSNFHMGIKFRAVIYFRGSLFLRFFYKREKREIEDPRNLVPIRNI